MSDFIYFHPCALSSVGQTSISSWFNYATWQQKREKDIKNRWEISRIDVDLVYFPAFPSITSIFDINNTLQGNYLALSVIYIYDAERNHTWLDFPWLRVLLRLEAKSMIGIFPLSAFSEEKWIFVSFEEFSSQLTFDLGRNDFSDVTSHYIRKLVAVRRCDEWGRYRLGKFVRKLQK